MTIEVGNPGVEDEVSEKPAEGESQYSVSESHASWQSKEPVPTTLSEQQKQTVTENSHAVHVTRPSLANRWQRMGPETIGRAHGCAYADAMQMMSFPRYAEGADKAITGMLESLRTRSVSGVVAYDMLLREKFHLERKDYLDENELSVAASLLTMSMY